MGSINIRGYKKRDGTQVGGHARSSGRGPAPDRHPSPEAADAAKAAASAAASDPVVPDDALMVDDLASWETREIEAVMNALGNAYDEIDSIRDDNCTPAAFRATDQLFESWQALKGEMKSTL